VSRYVSRPVVSPARRLPASVPLQEYKQTQVEFTLHKYDQKDLEKWQDFWNISLVNGYHYGARAEGPYWNDKDSGGTNVALADLGKHPQAKKMIEAVAATGNSLALGVYGIGNDECCAACTVPTKVCENWGGATIKNEAKPTSDESVAKCDVGHPPTCKAAGFEGGASDLCKPKVSCHLQGLHANADGDTFTVHILPYRG
jgi:hypothetical protein